MLLREIKLSVYWKSPSVLLHCIIEVIANNLANIDTPGFKKSYVVFEDILQDALGTKVDFPTENSSGILACPTRLKRYSPG